MATPATHLATVRPTREQRNGCLACGAELVYLAQAEPMVCAGCGASAHSNARCASGHFFCDTCHAGSADEVIAHLCLNWSGSDAMELVLAALRHPAVKMHGPEHHFLVPAALVTAWCNARGEPERRAALVAEARRRSAPVAGGFCGYQGACGAAIGAGIFASLATGSTPLAKGAWGRSQKVTAEALNVIADAEGPRCCKRDTFYAVLTAARWARRELHADVLARGPRCEFDGFNRECLQDACPFHRRGEARRE
jgi:hypothetical protein